MKSETIDKIATIANQRWMLIRNIIIYLETKFRPNRRILYLLSYLTSRHITTEPKVIAFESCLKSLFGRVVCTECGEPVSVDESTIAYNDTAMKVKFLCMKGQRTSWESQPLVNSKPAGNLMVVTAIILSGETFTRVSHFTDIFR